MSEQTRHSSETDMLTALLSQLDLRAGTFFAGSLCGSSDHEPGMAAMHILRRGRLSLVDRHGTREHVTAPCLILFSDGAPHRIETSRGSVAELVCATLEFADEPSGLARLGLPQRMIVPLDAVTGFDAILHLLFEEAFARHFGSGAVVDRLVELVVVMLLRHCMATGNLTTGMLCGLSEPRLSRSLRAMHLKPESDWTVERLAEAAGMSRTSFAAAFKMHVGMPPADYLTMLRIAAAKQALLRGRPIKSVAMAAGYHSPTAFSRAFQRRVGCGPRDFVRAARGDALADWEICA